MSATVSIVITTFDEEPEHLREAIQSALAQTIPPHEVIIVDDGSRRDNAPVWEAFPAVRAIRQTNQGLAAARNTGWRAATGTHVVFLDADDRLLPEALAINLRRFAGAPECGLVYGAYRFIDRDGKNPRVGAFVEVDADPYVQMLRGNPVGMHATVMYRRDALEALGGFDAGLRACEDYEIYLRAARRFPIACSPEVIAEYRRHGSNMSNNVPMMRRTVLGVLARHAPQPDDPREWREAWTVGMREWKAFYALQVLYAADQALRAGKPGAIPFWSIVHVACVSPLAMAGAVREAVGAVRRRRAVRFGDLRRTAPVSRSFGYDRGTPVDRRYVERFLARHATDVRGRVLEIGDSSYTRAFGGERVTHAEVLHVDPTAPNVTYVADLASGDGLPSDTFDCIVLTQTLHLIYDMPAAVATLHRILKPGGVVLLTVPGVSSVDGGEWHETWFWSLTPASLGRLLRQQFGAADVAITSYGNVLTAIAFLQGLAAEELRPGEYEVADPQYPVIVGARAQKAAV